jgi:hypothetical protein
MVAAAAEPVKAAQLLGSSQPFRSVRPQPARVVRVAPSTNPDRDKLDSSLDTFSKVGVHFLKADLLPA